jgi:hypothetical protein
MARRRNPPELVRAKWQLADRIRSIRTELYGERGLAELAKQIGVPVRTWYSYETGVTVPAEILLRFIELTHVEPLWLLHGNGNKYEDPDDSMEGPGNFASDGYGCDNSMKLGSTDELFGGPRFEMELPAGEGALGAGADLAVAVVEAEPSRMLLGRAISGPLQGSSVARRSFHCVRMEGDSMSPIIAPGAFVAYSDVPVEPDTLEGKMVVARLGNRTLVRWFHGSGRYALLRAENSFQEPRTELVDLEASADELLIRRVLWIGTSH